MLIFDQLRISDDGNRMYINIHVNTASYFDNIYLDSITIMTSDKVSETSPDTPTSDYIYTKTFTDDEKKEAALVLKATDFNETYTKSDMSNTLFFVYVKCKLVDSDNTSICFPCRLDEQTTLGVTFDENLLYQKVMDYTKSLVADCSTPTGFTDFILLWNAFKASIETEHYIPAIKFFNMLFDSVDDSGYTTIKGCGCNG